MSRIGKKVIAVPKGVTITVHPSELEVKGPKGTLKTPIPAGITFKIEGEELRAERASDEQAALHGLARRARGDAEQHAMHGELLDGPFGHARQ